MKVITLTQPWATLVAIRAKKIETRSWETLYRGPLAIHAAKGLGPVGGFKGLVQQCRFDPFRSVLRDAAASGMAPQYIDDYPRGAIVATCDLLDCQMIGVLPDETPAYMAYDEWPPVLQAVQEPERSFGLYTAGRYAWLLANIKALPEPIPCKGALGLWNFEGAL